MRIRRLISGALCLFIAMCSLQLYAQENSPPDTSTITLFIENDITDKTDWWYTSGAKIAWISPDISERNNQDFIYRWANSCMNHLPFVKDPELKRNISISIGQNMYTPKDIDASQPIENDRPYAGISYIALGFHGRDSRKMDTLEFVIGIVGPQSYAESAQKYFHKIFKNHQPQGWDNQLKNEPILNINFDRKWKLLNRPNGTKGYDIIPHTGILLGNAITAANMGAEIRFGCIPNDYGTYLIGSGNGNSSNAPLDKNDPRYSNHYFGAHLFAGVDTYAILRTIVLDGNTFADSQSIEKKPFVANLFAGIGITFHHMKITYAQVYRTKEFKGQNTGQLFGSLTISRSF
jgi:lipid A 3-O-deacylase